MPKPAYIGKTFQYERLVLRELQRVTRRRDLEREDVIAWSPDKKSMKLLAREDEEVVRCLDPRCWVIVKRKENEDASV